MEGERAVRQTFPDAFAEALRDRGVSLAWLHQRLVERGHPVSPAALSYWRSGRSQPERGTSRDALVEIERLLRIAPGSLIDRLGPSRRPGPRPGEKSVKELFADTPGVQPALDALGFEGLNDELVEVMRHLTVDIDATGRATQVQVRVVVQARCDGARRTPLIVTLDEDGRAPRFVPTVGCTIGRQRTDREAGVFSAELLLDRALAREETCVYELCVDLPEPSTDSRFDHYAVRRLGELLVWVRFSTARVPSRVERYTLIDGVEEAEEIALGGGTGAHALARGFGPGILGVRWTW
jgi:hypothetical protein